MRHQDSSPRTLFGPLSIYGFLALAGMAAPVILIVVNLIASLLIAPRFP